VCGSSITSSYELLNLGNRDTSLSAIESWVPLRYICFFLTGYAVAKLCWWLMNYLFLNQWILQPGKRVESVCTRMRRAASVKTSVESWILPPWRVHLPTCQRVSILQCPLNSETLIEFVFYLKGAVCLSVLICLFPKNTPVGHNQVQGHSTNTQQYLSNGIKVHLISYSIPESRHSSRSKTCTLLRTESISNSLNNAETLINELRESRAISQSIISCIGKNSPPRTLVPWTLKSSRSRSSHY
jgi:hypothetical protein